MVSGNTNVNDIDPNILARAQKGDSQAFSALIDLYQRPVYNLCSRMLGNPDEAEDAAQETFLRAYSKMRSFDGQRSFSTWLLSIAAHYCIDQIRKRRMTLVSFDDSPYLEPPDQSPGPEAAFSIRENQRHIQTLLARLGPQDRAAVIMRYWNDLSYEEIAEALSLSVSAVKSRLHRARLELAQGWIEQEMEQGQATNLRLQMAERKRHESPAL
jgi:RNA polymerase sigma-70 factor (ECF subfamily)